MIPIQVALVDESGTVHIQTLAEVAGALNEQIRMDFAGAWPHNANATVTAYRTAPAHAWPIRLREGLDDPGAAGYHTDEHRQPYALVDISAKDWTVTASHELLEMLADPFGSRLWTAAAPTGWIPRGARVRYLIEVCDPCEEITYEVGGVEVSDFVMPAFYRTAGRIGAYSHTGAITWPRVVLPGGYISFVDESGTWWQRFVGADKVIEDKRLGKFDGAASLREWTDEHARRIRAAA